MSSQNALVDRRVLGPCYKCTPRVASTSLECERARVHIMDCAGGAAGACARAAGRQDKWLVRPPLETLSRHGRVLRCFSWKCGTARWAAPRGASLSTPTIGLLTALPLAYVCSQRESTSARSASRHVTAASETKLVCMLLRLVQLQLGHSWGIEAPGACSYDATSCIAMLYLLGGVATLCTRNGLMDAAPSDTCVMRRTTNRVSDVVIESYRCAHIDNMLIY